MTRPLLRLLLLLCAILIITTVSATPHTRQVITSLPGYAQPLPSRWWNGFISSGAPPNNPNGKMYTHYVLVESENDPSVDPLLIWYNGGPGASSLFGLLVELGPLLLNDLSLQDPKYNTTGIPQLQRNLYSWSRNMSVLVTDNPPPTGFSYCDPPGPSGDGYSCGDWNDGLVATANYAFIKNWFQVWPEFAGRDLFIVGESYAGVYIPVIVQKLFDSPIDGVNLKGLAVGDGCMGTEVLCGAGGGPYYTIDWMHGHGAYSQKLHYQIQQTCSNIELRVGNLTSQCRALVDQIDAEIGGYYGYNYYDDCIDRNIYGLAIDDFRGRQYFSNSVFGGALNDYPCPGPAMSMYLNRSDVRTALGISNDAVFNNGDNGQGMNYSLTEKNVLPVYVQAVTKQNIRVLLYNGDTDPGINSFLTQDIYDAYFGEKMQFSETKSWHPWTLDGKRRMGGYVTEWLNGTLAFLTIRGSGHMVPEYKPASAYVMINSFVFADGDYPPYCASC